MTGRTALASASRQLSLVPARDFALFSPRNLRAALRTTATVLLTLLVCATAVAQSAAPIVLNPDAPRVGISRYRVTVALDPGEEAAAVVRDVAALVRARPEPYAAEGFTGFVATLSDARLGLLAGDRRVVLIEELGLGIQPRQQPSLAPAAPQRPPVATAQASMPRPQRSLSPAALSTGSTWSIGPYAYDGSGNIRAIGTDTFEYDAFGRLVTSHAAGQKQTFQYDRFGNLLRITTHDQPVVEIRPCVDPATNRLVEPQPGSDCNATGSHDAAGNVLTQDLDTFRYDALGMLSGAWIAGVHIVPLYTPSDERLATMRYGRDGATGQWTVHLGTDWTVRDTAGRVLRRFTETPTGTWSWTEDYIYLSDRLLAAEVATPEKTLHFFTDHLGTPRLITGNGGAKVAEHVYSAFGVEITSELQDAERMKFTGHERDASSLDHMHARAYRPNLGRFLSVDPDGVDLHRPQSWNRYSYVLNNPVNLTDPTGRCVWDVCVGEGLLLMAGGTALAATTTAWLNSSSPTHPGRTNGEVISGNIVGAVTGTIGAITSLAEKKDDPQADEQRGEGRTGGESKTVGQTKIGPKIVRVDVEKPQGGGTGNVHVQTKGKGGPDKWYIKDPKDLDKLPKAIRDSALIKKWVDKALDLLDKYRQ